MPPRPPPHHLGAITAYATRAPTRTDPRWYWQARVFSRLGARETLWVGRARRNELDTLLGPLVVLLGLDPAPPARFEPRDLSEGTTVGELAVRWIASVEAEASSYARSTLRNYRCAVRRLEWGIGRYALTEVSPFFLDRYRRARQAQGLQRSTTDLELRVLRTAWAWGRVELDTPAWPGARMHGTAPTFAARCDVLLALLRTGAPRPWAQLASRLVEGHDLAEALDLLQVPGTAAGEAARSYLRPAALVSFDEPWTSWDQLSLRSPCRRSRLPEG